MFYWKDAINHTNWKLRRGTGTCQSMWDLAPREGLQMPPVLLPKSLFTISVRKTKLVQPGPSACSWAGGWEGSKVDVS